MSKRMNITGQKFGRLTAIKFIEMRKNYHQYWLFKCDCGKEKVIKMDCVLCKHTKSCGCLNLELVSRRSFKHGMSKNRFYKIWVGMKQRCSNKNSAYYKDYGGRGIIVCKEWMIFKNFYNDMYKDYLKHIKIFGEKETSIDRKENNGNYCKKNCRWANPEIQSSNMRSNHLITYNKQTMTISQWSKKLNMNRGTLFSRILTLKWSIEKAFLTQVRLRRKRRKK